MGPGGSLCPSGTGSREKPPPHPCGFQQEGAALPWVSAPIRREVGFFICSLGPSGSLQLLPSRITASAFFAPRSSPCSQGSVVLTSQKWAETPTRCRSQQQLP